MDGAYEGRETRRSAFERGISPVVPPKKSRKNPWKYGKELYKQRNEAERMFRRLKGHRRIATKDVFRVYLSSCLVCHRRRILDST
jgi:transposase